MRGRGVVAGFIGAVVAVAAVYAAAWWIPLPERLEARGSTVVLYEDGSVAHAFLSEDEKWRIHSELHEIEPRYVEALIAFEDKRFWSHPGVDFIALTRAVLQDLWHREIVSGASTLTMQLVRITEPRPRTIRSKLIEMARAMQIEMRMSKSEILEAYLNYAPYGGNIEGIEAASLSYFGHRPDALTTAEIATLLAIPQDPSGRKPIWHHHNRELEEARDRIAHRLVDREIFDRGGQTDQEVMESVLRTDIPRQAMRLPREIPHAAQWFRTQRPSAVRIETTLDKGAQQLAQRTLAKVRAEKAQQGIHNASVVIANHRTSEIVALIGNFDFFDAENGGQIVGFAVPRSPGSTLKPFVYGSAIDRGLTLPEQLIADVPVRYGTYSPDNYDGEFSGMVELEQALARSLNIPFINLLSDIGVEPFLGSLRAGGVRSVHPTPGHYGLSLVAGGIEMTPLELAGLYAGIAQKGQARELVWEKDQTLPLGGQVMSAGAAYLVRRALSLRDRPDFPSRNQLGSTLREIHWKTGTSYGHRDAWAIGSGPRYTAAVWLGNFDNKSSTHLVGAEAAGPVLFDLLEGLSRGEGDYRPVPTDLTYVPVCALSGRLPGPHCPHRVDALAPVRNVPTERCELHQQIEVLAETGDRVAAACRAGRETEARVAVIWPSEVRRWMSEDASDPIPALAPECRGVASLKPPEIVSPGRDQVRLLVPGLDPSEQEIALTADAGGTALAWFVDGKYLGRSGADETVWWVPSVGRHTVVVQDDGGDGDRVVFEVRAAM